LSVEAVQERLTCVADAAVVARPAGALGATVSGSLNFALLAAHPCNDATTRHESQKSSEVGRSSGNHWEFFNEPSDQ